MRYCEARRERERKEAVYRAYIADALMALTENTVRVSGGKLIERRYADIVAPSSEAEPFVGNVADEAKRRLSAMGLKCIGKGASDESF